MAQTFAAKVTLGAASLWVARVAGVACFSLSDTPQLRPTMVSSPRVASKAMKIVGRVCLLGVLILAGTWRYLVLADSLTPTTLPVAELFGLVLAGLIAQRWVNLDHPRSNLWTFVPSIACGSLGITAGYFARHYQRSEGIKASLQFGVSILAFYLALYLWILIAPGLRSTPSRWRVTFSVAAGVSGMTLLWAVTRFLNVLMRSTEAPQFQGFGQSFLTAALAIYLLAALRAFLPGVGAIGSLRHQGDAAHSASHLAAR